MAFPDSDLDIVIEAFLGADPTADPGTWPTPVDLSSRLLNEPIQITTGRRQGQKTAAAGSCMFVLDNDDGALTPLLATSTYFPGWDLGVPVRVSVDNIGSSPPYPQVCGYAASIEPTMVPKGGGDVTSAVRVTLGGVLRRISQGAVALSPLARTIAAASPFQYWPLEADLASALPAGSALSPPTGAVEFAATDGAAFPGMLDLVAATETFIVGTAPIGGADFQVEFVAVSNLGVLTPVMAIYAVNDAFGTGVPVSVVAVAADGLPHNIAIRFETSGADVAVNAYRDGTLSSSVTLTNATIKDAATVQLRHGTSTTGTVLIGQVAVLPVSDPNDRIPAIDGYAGEQAHVRIERVCAEEGIPYSSTATESVACGPQPVADVVTVLQDAETVDHGMLTELISTWGLGYRASGERANLDPSLTVDLSTYRTKDGTSVQVLVPARNDQRIRNEWTITRPEGATATVRDEAHQAKRGRYNDEATVNVYTNDGARDEAGWRVWEGTVEQLRYIGLPVDLGANTSLIQDWLDLQLGDRVDRTDHPSPPHPHGDVPFTVEGYTETLRRTGWLTNLVVEPYNVWRVGLLADTAGDTDPLLGRLAGDEACALRVDVDDNDTSFPFDPNHYRWTTDADDFDPDLRVSLVNASGIDGGGETVEVSTIATTAAAYVAVGTADHDDNAAVTPGDYAGGATADWVVVVAGSRDTTSPTLAITDAGYPTWYLMGHQGGLYVWATIRTATTPAPTVTPTGGAAGDTVSAQVFGLRNMPITLDLDQYVLEVMGLTNSSAQDIAHSGLVAGIYPGRVILIVARKSDDWTSVAVPTGFTEITETSSTSGSDQGLYAAYRTDTTPALVNSGSIVVTGGAGAVSNSLVLALTGGFQTMTVSARSVNGVVKAHDAGTRLEATDALVLAL